MTFAIRICGAMATVFIAVAGQAFANEESSTMNMQVNLESTSQKNGMRFLSKEDRKVYSVGISTGGDAEMEMARADETRTIIATTIDPKGAEYAKQRIEDAGLSQQIDVQIEDVSSPLPYEDGHFDYIYARLVLHYLPKDALNAALNELYRVLRVGGRIFIVVRSIDCPEARDPAAKFDRETCLTTCTSNGNSYSRYFHSQESIQHHLSLASFSIEHVNSYQEQLCIDFQRTELSQQLDNLIEVVAKKA